MKITFLGGGNMASALIGGLLKQQVLAASDIQVVEVDADGRRRLMRQFGVRCFDHVFEVPLWCDVIVLAVKPQQMREALAEFSGKLTKQLVISVAAGLRVPDLAAWLGDHPALVRCMPNTPALIGQGITGLYAHPSVDTAGRELAERILSAVGGTVWVEDEALMDVVTAISGSGPAYVYRFIESLAAAGVAEGLTPDTAQRLAIATFAGASQLAAASPETPAVLRERVTSKGGTTEAALRSMQGDDLDALIARAVAAAVARGRELGDQLAKN